MQFIGNTLSLTSQEQEAVLNFHNTNRQALAQGKITNGKIAFPTAVDMPNLVSLNVFF